MRRNSEGVQGLNLVREIRLFEDQTGISSKIFEFSTSMVVLRCKKSFRGGSRSESGKRNSISKANLSNESEA